MIYIINKVLGTARKGGAISSFLIFISHLLFVSCANDDEVVISNDPVNVELSYAFSLPATGGITRQASDVVTSDATTPRLPYFMRLIPLINAAPQLGDISWEDPVNKENPNSRFYRSRYCSLDIGVNGLLVYGGVVNKAVPEGKNANLKMYNGSLLEAFPSTITTVTDVQEGISFSLEPIYKASEHSENGIPSGAQTLAGYMTAIATTKIGEETEKFYNSTDGTISGFFEKFSNEGKPLPGSAASVKVWIEKFIESIQPTIDDTENTAQEIRDKLTIIKNAASDQITRIGEITATSYPRNLYLPDGAAVLRWDMNVNKFVPQINTTTLENINSIARFAYPAPLYYYVSSDIKTSDEKVDLETIYNEVVSDETKTAWDKVLANEKFNKTAVNLNTRAVALAHPVQFAVAQLKVNIKAYSGTLKDADNNNVTVDGEKFPLKGIVVCDQRPVNYRFEPKEVEQGTVSDAEVLFIYDNQVKENCYLLPQAEGVWAEGCSTMVLQSLKDENVNIILEFENKSGAPFSCIDGMVYPDTRFYMIGRVEASLYKTSDQHVNDENRGQVFTKDYITTVNMTVSSLAKAYNVPPNLLSPNLEIGVETTPQWEGATPTVIRLE